MAFGFCNSVNSRRNKFSKLADLFLDATYEAVGLHNSTLYSFYLSGGGRGREGGRGISRKVLSHDVASVCLSVCRPTHFFVNS